MLWNRSLVMQDRETGSLWSHLLGEAMRGPLQGKRLAVIPSQMTDWRTWRTTHPQTTVVDLPRTSREYRREFYRDPDQFVLGIVLNGEARSWSLKRLIEQPVINDRVDQVPVVVFYDHPSSTMVVFDRQLDGKELTFRQSKGGVIDDQTLSHWDRVRGRAIGGPLAGKQLKMLPGIVSYRRAWEIFHPPSAK